MSETFAPQVPQWRVAFYRRPLWLVESLHLGLSPQCRRSDKEPAKFVAEIGDCNEKDDICMHMWTGIIGLSKLLGTPQRYAVSSTYPDWVSVSQLSCNFHMHKQGQKNKGWYVLVHPLHVTQPSGRAPLRAGIIAPSSQPREASKISTPKMLNLPARRRDGSWVAWLEQLGYQCA